MYKATIKATGEKMDKTIAVIQKDLATLRAGRANPQILDKITVDYYGTPTPLNQVGNISSPEPRLLVISPWESKMISDIEKAIQKSDLGMNPTNDGKIIRLVFPELNEERRKELTKVARKSAEEAKVAIRAIRRDAIEQVKKLKKDSLITEGCMIYGKVSHSVLSAGVLVEEGANVQDAVVMPGAVIKRGAVVRRAIVAENAVIGAGSLVGEETGNIAVVGPNVTLPAGVSVAAGVQVDEATTF